MAGRFDDDEKRLEKETSIEDTTTDVFYDDTEERGEKECVYVMEFNSKELGRCFSIQVPFANLWIPEEMFRRVAIGVENGMKKLRTEDMTKIQQIPCSHCGLKKSLNKECRCPIDCDHDPENECKFCGECRGVLVI